MSLFDRSVQRQSFLRSACRVALVLCWLLAGRAAAQLPHARLVSIFPPGGQAGCKIDATIGGIDLDDAAELRFTHDGIVAQKSGGADKFSIRIDPQVPPGTYEVRVVGRYGITNPRAFVVSDRPEIVQAEPHHSASDPTPLPWGGVCNGRLSAGTEDCFAITAEKGKRILIECAAADLDSHADPVLTLYDANGRELGHSRGGFLDCTAPADGPFLLKLHDLLYRGGPEYFYRLSAGDGPHLDFVFPPAGVPGTTGRYTLYGRNLPGGTSAGMLAADGKPLERLDVDIQLSADPVKQMRPAGGPLAAPIACSVDGIEYRLHTNHGTSNPVTITFAAAPIVLERDRDNAQEAQTVCPPCEIVGRLYPRGHRGTFCFDAHKSDAYRIEVFCHRLGLPANPLLLVQWVTKDDKGQKRLSDLQEVYPSETNVGGFAFAMAAHDPAVRFQSPEDGTYQVQVRDLFNQSEPNPALVYRLSIRKEDPGFGLVAIPEAPPPVRTEPRQVSLWSPLLRRAGTVPITIFVLRHDDFGSAVELQAEGLPPGVTCPAVVVPAGVNVATLLLSADEAAAGWVGPVRCVGKATVGDQVTSHQALAGTVVYNSGDAGMPGRSRISADLMLAISGTETEPLSIRLGPEPLPQITASGKVQVAFKIIRRGDFKGPLKMRAYGLPGTAASKEIDVPPNAESGSYELDLAPFRLPPGSYTFCLQAVSQGRYSRANDPTPKDVTAAFYSNPIVVKVKQ